MINFERAQWAEKIILVLKDGEIFKGSGAGILLAEDFDNLEYQYDTFYLNDGKSTIAFKIDEIEDIEIFEE
ncbi:hypothetical protein ABLW17_07240 [Anaerococcus murdochii]|uniref:hypothetical protein n=1 Tax=Anaerococcus murdochii TaxID=411577 RepID=UPI0032B49D14